MVLNSSFTFRDYAYLNNARQVPMLPDWAVIDLNTSPNSIWPGKVVTEVEPAGDFWQAEPEHQDYLLRYPDGYTCHFPRPNWKLPKVHA